MASVLARPGVRSSANRPLQYLFSSNKYPNTETGGTKAITDIRNPTAGEQISWGVESDVVVVEHIDWDASDYVEDGQHIRITDTDNDMYYNKVDSNGTAYGLYKVVRAISTEFSIIDAEYEGDETGGSISKFYHNFQIGARLYLDNEAFHRDQFRVKPTGTYGSSQFWLDVSDGVASMMGPDGLPLPNTTTANMLIADDPNYQVNKWMAKSPATHRDFHIEYWEIYDVPTNGINELTHFSETVDTETDAINTLRPMVQFQDGDIFANFQQSLDSVFLLEDPLSGLPARFMTNAPSTQWIGRDEFHSMMVMLSGSVSGRLQIKTYEGLNETGTLIATTTCGATSLQDIAQIHVGTRHMGTGIITPATRSYSVAIWNSGLTQQLSERRVFNIDDECNPNVVDFHFLGLYGSNEKIRFTGHRREKLQSKRRAHYVEQGTKYPTFNDKVHIVENKHTMRISTRIPQAQMEWFSEMLRSPWVSIIHPDSDQYLPVVIMDSTIELQNSQKNQNRLVTIEYRYAWKQESHRG